MKRLTLAVVLTGALVAPASASASKVDYAQAWFESRSNVLLVICDSTPMWRHRKFPIYCGIGYKSGRWSDYRVRIAQGRVERHRIGTTHWTVESTDCEQPVGEPETCTTTCDVPESPEPCPVEAS